MKLNRDQIDKWLDGHIHELDFPMAYMGKELNLPIRDWENSKFKVLVLGTSSYKNLIGNQANGLLIQMVSDKFPDWYVDRAFLPNTRLELKKFENAGIPIFGLSSRHPMSDYDVVLVSVSACGDDLNAMYMMKMSDIPMLTKDRDPSNHPFFIRGGADRSHNGPYAEVYDICYIGDAETNLCQVLATLYKEKADWVKSAANKPYHLKPFANIEGCYVGSLFEELYEEVPPYEVVCPEAEDGSEVKATIRTPVIKGWKPLIDGIPEKVRRTRMVEPDKHFVYNRPVLSNLDTAMSAGTLLISRGCANKCRFSITDSSYIITHKGPRQLKEWSHNKKDMDLNVLVATDSGPKVATRFLDEGVKDVVRVTFDNGFHIDCTPEHRFLASSDLSGRSFWREAKDFRSGDTLLEHVGQGMFDVKESKVTWHAGFMRSANGRPFTLQDSANLQIRASEKGFSTSFINHPYLKGTVTAHFSHKEFRAKDWTLDSLLTLNRASVVEYFNGLLDSNHRFECRTYDEALLYKAVLNNAGYFVDVEEKKIAWIIKVDQWDDPARLSTTRVIRVVSVTPRPQQAVYDITVPDGENFWCDGVISHNCNEGGCLTADTFIPTSDGIRTLGGICGELKPKEFRPVQDLVVYNESGQGKLVSHVFRNGKDKGKKVTTSYGFGLKGTDNHPIKVWKSGKLEWAKLEDLRPGDVVPLSVRRLLSDSAEDNPFNYKYKVRGRNNAFILPEKMSSEFAYFLAYWMCDGSWSQTRFEVFFGPGDSDSQDRVERFLKSCGVSWTYEREPSVLRLRFNWAALSGLLECLGFARKQDFYRIPEVIFSGSSLTIQGFVQGLFDADGGISVSGNRSEVGFYSVSSILIKDLQNLLSFCGVGTSKKVHHEDRMNWIFGGLYHEKKSYTLTVLDAFYDVFASTLGFYNQKKQEKLLVSLAMPAGTCDFDSVPGLQELVRRLVFSVKSRSRRDAGIYNFIKGDIKGLTYRRLGELLEKFSDGSSDVLCELEKIYGDRLLFDVVESVEDITEEFWDISVPDGHLFVANGFLSSNTELPYRELSPDKVVQTLSEIKKNSGAVDLLPSAFCSSTYTKRKAITKWVLENCSDSMAFISMRADETADDPDFVGITALAGNHTVSLGVEGLSQRMRDRVNKNVTEEHIVKAAEYYMRAGYTKIKFFMIANLTMETEEDQMEWIDTLKKIKAIKDELGVKTELLTSFTPLVIQPHVAMQWFAPPVNKRSLHKLLQAIKTTDTDFRLGSGARKEEAYYAQVCHLADRRFTSTLVDMVNNGYVHYGCMNKGATEFMKISMARRGVSFEYYFREKKFEDVLPWDFSDMGPSKEWLWKERQNYIDAKTTDKCVVKCSACGVCTPEEQKQVAKLRKAKDDPIQAKDINVIVQKGVVERMRLGFTVDPKFRFLSKEAKAHTIRRAFYQMDYPIVARVNFASDHIKLRNWIAGKDYVDIDFTERIMGDIDMVKLNSFTVPHGISLENYETYDGEVLIMRFYSSLCLYKIETDKLIAEVKSAIDTFMGTPKPDMAELEQMIQQIESFEKYSDARPWVQKRNAWIKAHPTVVGIKEKDFNKGFKTVYYDARPMVEFMFPVLNAKAPARAESVYMLLRGNISPYDIFTSIFKVKFKAALANVASRVDFFNEESLNDDQDSFLTVTCSKCGRHVEENILKELTKGDLCLRCALSQA